MTNKERHWKWFEDACVNNESFKNEHHRRLIKIAFEHGWEMSQLEGENRDK